MNSSRIRKLITLLGFLAALPAATPAQSGVASLSGVVTDAVTELPLAGTRVSVAGVGDVYTNRFGAYSVTGLEAGEHRVTFSYVGHQDVMESVVVGTDGTGRLDVRFGGDDDAVNLAEYVIEGSVVGTARAINQQRASDTLVNIVAADEIGRFPDQNAAEALQRIREFRSTATRARGATSSCGGLNYTFTSVKVNGGSFAGADLGERATALDVIPAMRSPRSR
jgi:hypothetical protein